LPAAASLPWHTLVSPVSPIASSSSCPIKTNLSPQSRLKNSPHTH
jgi:hypothetical protein